MNACSVPIPPGEIGTSVARLWVDLHEQDVADRLLDSEGVEEEPDRDETEQPVSRLPERHFAEVAALVAQHREPLADALLELGDVQADPEEADHAEDHKRDEEDDENSGFAAKKPKSNPGSLPSEPTAGRTPSVSA